LGSGQHQAEHERRCEGRRDAASAQDDTMIASCGLTTDGWQLTNAYYGCCAAAAAAKAVLAPFWRL